MTKIVKDLQYYKTLYRQAQRFLNNPCVDKALLYAFDHPVTVYGKESREYSEVERGIFDMYFKRASSKLDEVGAKTV